MSIKDKYHVKKVFRDEYKEWLLKKHYAHRIPSVSYAFGLYDENNIIQGVCTFGMTANNNLNEIVNGFKSIELNRLVVNQNDKNMTSFFVSSCLKNIDSPIVVISYADNTHNHKGYIYQATNWIYTGLGKGDYEFKKNGKQYHRKNIYDMLGTGSIENAIKNGYEVVKVGSKHRYIMLLGNKTEKKKMLHGLKWKSQPYPKGDNKNYDASYEPEIQLRLF